LRRGVAIDVVAARGRNKRFQLVMTKDRNGREVICWRSATTVRGSRPGLRILVVTAAAVVAVTDQPNAATRDQVKTGHLRSVVMVASVGLVGQVLR